jgi:hypothetical protein
MGKSKRHDLFDFMSQIGQEIASEYQRIRKRADEDPGTAGDQGEENWAALLGDWLPPSYQVVTKGRLIGHDGTTSPQIDVLVLKPSYPRKLLDKKLYLASGVAAAFECKLTLKASHIAKLVRNCIAIKSLFRPRRGSPYRELRTPIIYGLLAHSHSWKAAGSDPIRNIEGTPEAADSNLVLHPRFGVDLLCVSDLASWTNLAMPFFGPAYVPPGEWKITSYPDGYAGTSYIAHTRGSPNQVVDFSPIGVLISYFMQKLAWEDSSCRDLADYYRLTNLSGNGAGVQRMWRSTIYSDEVRAKVTSGMLRQGVAWDEWLMGIT